MDTSPPTQDALSPEQAPFNLYDRVKRRGETFEADASVMAVQRFDKGWMVWMHRAAYGSNAIVPAEELILLRPAPARSEALATPINGEECWVLQRNDRPHAVFLSEEAALTEMKQRRQSEMEWREQNAHVADVRTYWNVYKADACLAALGEKGVGS